jgi:sterol desaturase/sphingolipid hydroxylase (fatty acid hydroxylase superfamily)
MSAKCADIGPILGLVDTGNLVLLSGMLNGVEVPRGSVFKFGKQHPCDLASIVDRPPDCLFRLHREHRLCVSLFWEKGLAKYKIQKRKASPADIRREIRNSLNGMLISSMFYTGVYFGWKADIFTIYLGIAPLGWSYMLFSIAAIMVANDTYFYWAHRLLHLRPFVWFHRTHHQSITPTAYAGFAFDFSEAALLAVFLPLWLLVVPMQLPALSIYFTFMVVQIILGHIPVSSCLALAPRAANGSVGC